MAWQQIEHSEIFEGVEYTLTISPEDVPVRGNVSAFDEETDRKAEDEVIAQLQDGNLWAWCQITVTASIQQDGVRFEGHGYLGACSYRSRDEFLEPGGYWEDMKEEARTDLEGQLLQDATRGTYALEILKEHFGLDLSQEWAKLKQAGAQKKFEKNS